MPIGGGRRRSGGMAVDERRQQAPVHNRPRSQPPDPTTLLLRQGSVLHQGPVPELVHDRSAGIDTPGALDALQLESVPNIDPLGTHHDALVALDAAAGGGGLLSLPTGLTPGRIIADEEGFVVGVSNSADPTIGYRTRLFLLNTDRDGWTTVLLTLYDVSGTPVGPEQELDIAPGVLRNFDLATKFGVEGVTGAASLKVEVVSGGAVAAYATEVDNRTNDSIFVPAQPRFIGAAN